MICLVQRSNCCLTLQFVTNKLTLVCIAAVMLHPRMGLGVDYCILGHMCHMNATCLNLQTTYACQCNAGYFGDGHFCHGM